MTSRLTKQQKPFPITTSRVLGDGQRKQHPAATPPSAIKRRRLPRWPLAGYLFLLPNGIGFVAFMLIPLLASLALAFTDWQMLSPDVRFVGLGNFIRLLGFTWTEEGIVWNDPDFWYFLYNTLFLMLGVPISMFVSLGLAILVNNRLPGIVVFRTLFYLPTICNGIAVLMLWRLMFHADVGLLNQMLGWVGIDGPDWLQSTAWAKPALIIVAVWIAAGGNNMIIYLAGLQNIPAELYEAANLDGAGWWSRLRHITWPQLAPSTFFIFTMGIIGAFQGGFNAAYIMTQGGPAGSTTTISYYIFNTAYDGQLLMGYGCAIAWVLFLLVMTITLVNWYVGRESALEGH